MSATLSDPLRSFRIGDPDGVYPIFDATGSTISPGRWNESSGPMLYTCAHYSTAMLEKLVHGSGRLPPNQHFVEVTIPAGVTYEVFSAAHHPGWELQDCLVARRFGHAWIREKRSAILIVPSVVARMEENILINPAHADFAKIKAGLHTPVWWDARLFAKP